MALINTDIYNIRQSIEDLKEQYIPEETETLALGIFGYLGDLEAKKIQTAAMMVGELENEVFPNRAKLDKNIITHAIMQNITDINATPAYMTIILGISTIDLDKYMENNKFTFDKDFPIIITDPNTLTDYEYHLDYDIVLTRSTRSSNQVYAAVYDIDRDNSISTITNPYLSQPYTLKMNDRTYVFVQCTVRQVHIETKYNQLVNSNIIDNKTYTFDFDDQLADFEIRVTEGGNTLYLTPIFEGAAIDAEIQYYCYYTYITTNIIRVKFERASYMPGLNAEIEVIIKTTKGSEAIFNCDQDLYISLSSTRFNYDNIMLFMRPNTNSMGGVDRKTTEELHNIIPKEMLSRGCITTETDLMNYFNLINTSDNRLDVMKKIDNQIDRIYYVYFLMKNSENNVVPTNTINIDIRDLDFEVYNLSGTSILPAGTMIEYDPKTHIGTVVKERTSSPYLYTTLYTIMVNHSPLYTSSYMCIINESPYLSFEYINQDTEIQFISENVNFVRKLLVDKDKYTLTFNATQNINTPLYDQEECTTPEEKLQDLSSKIKAVIVLYNEGIPYRYEYCTMTKYDEELFRYSFEVDFFTDNMFDIENNIKLLDMNIAGSLEKNYGYFKDSTEAYIYIITNLGEDCGVHDLGQVIPDLSGWSVTNKYEIFNGLTLFVNYSSLMTTRIVVSSNIVDCEKYMYSLSSIPVIEYNYISDDDKVFEFVDQLHYKKMYIDNALELLENSFEIDFKFFNSYGPSRTYTIDELGENTVGNVSLELRFDLSLKSSADNYTKDSIMYAIKEYVENLDREDDLHIPNLVSYIQSVYANAINYFGWHGFNTFDANYQHLYKQERDDKTICPEFLNVINTTDVDGNTVPNITIETTIA